MLKLLNKYICLEVCLKNLTVSVREKIRGSTHFHYKTTNHAAHPKFHGPWLTVVPILHLLRCVISIDTLF